MRWLGARGIAGKQADQLGAEHVAFAKAPGHHAEHVAVAEIKKRSRKAAHLPRRQRDHGAAHRRDARAVGSSDTDLVTFTR